MNNFPAQLSGGEQQRVAIARAISKNPKLLLCDEPTGALDYKTGKQILKLLEDTCHKENMTVIIVTHNPQFIVNLDVDNVIYLGKSDEQFYVQSGALEYKEETYSILDIISSHIEGGLETIKRRWKRYEKGNSI